MAKAKLSKKGQIKLTLSVQEANFIRHLSHNHCAGVGFYDTGYSRIGHELEQALPPEYQKRLNSAGGTVIFNKELDDVGYTAA